MLYRKFVHPALVRREQRIDAMIEEAQTRGYQAAVQLGGRGIRLVMNSLYFNTINVTVVFMGRNDFDAGTIHYEGPPFPMARVMDLAKSKSSSLSAI